MTSLLRITFAYLLLTIFGTAQPEKNTINTEVELFPQYSEVTSGTEFYLYASIQHPDGWYAYYYNNTVDSTIRPTISVEPQEGITVGETQYPLPKVKSTYGVENYIFDGKYYLRVPVTISDEFAETTASLRASVRYQICKESCLPPETQPLTFDIKVGILKPNSDFPIEAESKFSHNASQSISAVLDKEAITLSIPGDLTDPTFYDLDGQTHVGIPPEVQTSDGNTILTLPLDQGNDYRLDKVTPQERLKGHLVIEEGQIWIDTPLLKLESEKITNHASPSSESTTTQKNSPTPSRLVLPDDATLAKLYNPDVPILKGTGTTLWRALLGAFLGGILLNLMPCVFPVLSLKVLSFVEKAGEEKWKVRIHGILFTFGVLISMWVLALVLFAVKHFTGQSISWGQQMSYPLFVGPIIVILFLFGLNMAGIFEFGTKLTTLGSRAESKNGYVATLLSGVLTTVIATPCSGPFLGAAMSYTLSQPILISLILFSVFALGISFPYLILSFFPALTAKLPRPGTWMETLKVILSFGMFAAAAFFMQTFASLTGGQGLAVLVMALVIIALAAYLYGHWNRPHLSKATRYGLGTALPIIILGTGLLTGWKASTNYQPPVAPSAQSSGEVVWYDWKPGIVE